MRHLAGNATAREEEEDDDSELSIVTGECLWERLPHCRRPCRGTLSATLRQVRPENKTMASIEPVSLCEGQALFKS